MIDLHSHILPGLDDGAADVDTSLAMARAAVDDGVEVMVATPHVSFDYPVEPWDVAGGVEYLNVALARAEIPLSVLPGGEIALPRLTELDDLALQGLALGGGPYLLLESPYTPGVAYIEELVFAAQVRGFRVLLAHPERCPAFQRDPARLARLVERGVLCSVDAGSMMGRFGRTVHRFVVSLFLDGLVHNVASDSHDERRRPPGLRAAFRAAEADLPGLAAQRDWLTHAVPAAVLSGGDLPPRPAAIRSPGRSWRRRLARSGRR